MVGRTEAPVAPRAFGAYQPGFDGMRGLGMLVMMAFHAQFDWASGAFFTLSQFFTLSGFLITALLLRDQQQYGRLDLKRFWIRRFRRLIPAAYVGLFGVMIFGATVATKGQAEALPGEVLGAAAYVTNWLLIATDVSYLELFADPSPVQHYWSLAVEEQFYLLMPVALFGVLRLRRGLLGPGLLFAGVTLASTIWAYWLFRSGASIDRVYYGTDTRIGEILVGAFLAVILTRTGSDFSPTTRRVLGSIGFVAAMVSLWLMTTADLTNPDLWRGGLLGFAIMSALVVVGIIADWGPLKWLYRFPPLAFSGRIVYGLYVYHFPIFLWLDESRTGLGQWPLFGLRLAVTYVVAFLSHRYLEEPIRRGETFGLPRPVRLVSIPAIGSLLVIGTALTATDSGADPLGAIREEDTVLAMPVLSSDGVLDVLAIGDDPGAGVIEALVEMAEEDVALEVTDGGTFACAAELVELDSGPVCERWEREWPALIEEHDPDLVLVHIDDWSGVTDDTPEGVESEVIEEMAHVLRKGIELLSDRDAPILWAQTSADFGTAIQRDGSPFGQAMGIMESERARGFFRLASALLPDPTSVQNGELARRSAEAILSEIELYQRADDDDRTRVMVIGDSQGRSLAHGLERWAAANGEALVWNAGALGCGFVTVGEGEHLGRPEPVPERCIVAREGLAAQVEAFGPDLVIVYGGARDIGDRRLVDGGELLSLGDPELDAVVGEDYRAVADTLVESGASVLWMTLPCRVESSGLAPDIADVNRKVEYLNQEIIAELDVIDGVEIYDLADLLCPGGEAVESVDGVGVLRPDGVHFSIDASFWFAEEYGTDLLASVL